MIESENMKNDCIKLTIDEWAKRNEPSCDPELLKLVRTCVEHNEALKELRLGVELWQKMMDGADHLRNQYYGLPLDKIPLEEVECAVLGNALSASCDDIWDKNPID